MHGMPRVTPSKVVTGLILTIFGFVVYKYVFGVKYEAKYEYSSYYKSLSKKPREDLKPKIVYRGTGREANISDLALVKTKKEREEMEKGYREVAYNVLVSRRIGEYRELPDTRHKTCLTKEYPTVLLSASVIVCFYNEHTETLFRTVESILRRSPGASLLEIILVNDGSEREIDRVEAKVKEPSWSKVRLLHTGGREGLIRARILGARNASGDVLVFLDSHIECNQEWLEPLLSRISDSWSTVVVPIIDSIDPDIFTYKPSPLVRGGMTWGLIFKWDGLPKNTLDTVEKFSAPIPSPTMAGGLFAISRKYFHHIGEYDSGLEIWGGENIEMSLRIWMCGGRLEIIPCSRVGHVFRKRRPYTSTNHLGQDTQLLNVARVARVWLDEYIKYFYESVPEAEKLNVGDISDRIELKSRLDCKNFKWFHENVYPELVLPGQLASQSKIPFQAWDQRHHNFTESFHLIHVESGLCVQPQHGVKGKGSDLILKNCFRTRDQIFFSTSKSELLPGGYLCLDSSKGARLQKCTEMEGPQHWTLKGGRRVGEPGEIYSKAAGLCLGTREKKIITVLCDSDQSQVWFFKPSY